MLLKPRGFVDINAAWLQRIEPSNKSNKKVRARSVLHHHSSNRGPRHLFTRGTAVPLETSCADQARV